MLSSAQGSSGHSSPYCEANLHKYLIPPPSGFSRAPQHTSAPDWGGGGGGRRNVSSTRLIDPEHFALVASGAHSNDAFHSLVKFVRHFPTKSAVAETDG